MSEHNSSPSSETEDEDPTFAWFSGLGSGLILSGALALVHNVWRHDDPSLAMGLALLGGMIRGWATVNGARR